MAPTASEQGTAKSRYEALKGVRQNYLTRARQHSELTIPSLFPPEGWNGTTDLVAPYQSIGANGVDSLSAKFAMVYFPPNQPFFRLKVEKELMAQIPGGAASAKDIDEGLAEGERMVTARTERAMVRPTVQESFKHLIVGGNVCIQRISSRKVRLHSLSNYVCVRDPGGEVVEAVIEERISPRVLPSAFLSVLSRDMQTQKDRREPMKVYTWLRREGKMMLVHQEIEGKIVPGTEGSWPHEVCPFLFLRWNKQDGTDYSRSLCDSLEGDLRAAEGLSASIQEGAAALAKLLILVNPSGLTREEDVAAAPNLAVRSGRADDVTTVSGGDKARDFAVAERQLGIVERRLMRSFLMTGAIQRDAERVTAEEIRLLADELEEGLGGVYSLHSQEFVYPFLVGFLWEMNREGDLPDLKGIEPTVITGLAALGRSAEVNRLITFARAAREVMGDTFVGYIKPLDTLRSIATAVGLNPTDIVLSANELAERQAQQTRSALVEQLGPEAIRQSSASAAQQGA